MEHVTVFREQGTYAGWPANHGAWQWGDEFLVGFISGPYKHEPMHNVGEPLTLRQARSCDGGKTWAVEEPGIPTELDPVFVKNEHWGDEAIIRVRGVYDHGGDYVPPEGGFFVSVDRGHEWSGPFAFAGLEDVFADPQQCTARTSVLGDLVFLSRADQRMWGTDETFCASFDGHRFALRGWVCNDDARSVMPVAARIGKRIVAVCRRRSSQRRGGWIEAFGSDDDGRNWRPLSEVGQTGKNNGNPPALIAADGILVCAYGNRTDHQIIARASRDGGQTWSLPLVLRQGEASDIGYSQLLRRQDGALVCVYYWAQDHSDQQHIEATHFAVGDIPQ